MARVRLKPKEDRRLLRGHLWAYRNELDELSGVENGAVTDVFSDSGRFVGRGFYQAQGGIAVRLLSRHQAEIDGAFLARRVLDAHEFRCRLFPHGSVYRWVFAESDGLPGFVADRYGPVVSAETACAFYADYVEDLAAAFQSIEGVAGVRVNVCGQVHRFGRVDERVICEIDGLKFGVDVDGGQKTGMFLDQRVNSALIAPFAEGARVFDGHCYMGMWSCRAARAGAREVLGVDSSEHAVELARANAELNGYSDVCQFERGDVEAVLRRGQHYDVVLLDPPALAKTRAQAHKAAGLYQALNKTAMEAVVPGGILITSTCSHFMAGEAFLEVLKRAGNSARRQALVVDVRGGAPDHPVLMSMPETGYLTCVALRLM